MAQRLNQSSELNIRSILSGLSISHEIDGDDERFVKNISSITNAKEDDLSFCYYEGKKAVDLILQSRAGVILCKKSLRGFIQPRKGVQLIFIDNPRYVFVKLANEIFVKQKKLSRISPSVLVSKTAKIGDNCYVGEHTIIGDNCDIGKDTMIYDKVTLVRDCVVGNRCVIHSGVTLGDDGFAFERDENGILYQFPHLGKVVIGDDVEICANSHIAKGSLSDTTIGNGTKIDSMVHISHNVIIGKNCELTAGSVIGGSAEIGDFTWIGLNATLKDHVKIGKNAIVASGASVIHDVPDNDIVAGVPARSIKNKVNASSDDLFLMAGHHFGKKKEK